MFSENTGKKGPPVATNLQRERISQAYTIFSQKLKHKYTFNFKQTFHGDETTLSPLKCKFKIYFGIVCKNTKGIC